MISIATAINAIPAAVNQPSGRARDEYQVLLQCILRALQPSREPLVFPSVGFHWPRLIALAHRHDVMPLLNAALSGSASVPATERRHLESHCRTVIAHNLCLASELAELLELFERSAISAMPFKGPAWTQALYGDLAHRQIRDLDIFVDPSDTARAGDLLTTRGYVRTERSKAKPMAQCKDLELTHPGTGIHLELHWSACEPWHDKRASRLKLWNPAGTTILLNRPMPLPSAENIFFLLAIHGARHRWESLKWICDIAVTLQVFPELDWDAILAQADRIGRKRMALVPLALVNQIFDAALPVSVRKAIEQDAAVAPLAARIQRQHSADAGAHLHSRRKAVAQLIFCEGMRIRMRESRFERFYLLAVFFLRQIEPNASDRVRLPHRKLPEPLYWLLRPIRLIRIYGSAAILKFARDLIGGGEGPGPG